MKRAAARLLTLLLCLSLLPALPAAAADAIAPSWSSTSEDGQFVTVRLEYPEGKDLPWAESRYLFAACADTGAVIPLSDYYDGGVYAILPAGRADEPLTVKVSQPIVFTDQVKIWNSTEYDQTPMSAQYLSARGVLKGNEKGELLPDDTITRAEAFALLLRILGVESSQDPGYADVSPDDWYYPTAAAARSFGLAAKDTNFNPSRTVTRAEVMVMAWRAFDALGMAPEPDPEADLGLEDGGTIPGWALSAYQGLTGRAGSLCITTQVEAEDCAEYTALAEPLKPATRLETVELLYSLIRFLPVYPSSAAIAYGFDQSIPVMDGSTSTYPYTSTLFRSLFHNGSNHPAYISGHSKSHASYQRLISGEVDVLFAATEPSEALKAEARAAGVELELIPISYDAMVFFTNEENSVSGLTRKQIQDIYVRNACNNWNQVGGPDAALLPYCRNTDSGSHALMERYFLDGGALSLSSQILQGNVSQAMSTALTDVAAALQTDPPGYAIGYSVYYYYLTAVNMMDDVTSNRLKLLAVDGVLPSDETIADGSYPLAGYNYLVLRADTPEDAPARKLAAFMLSPEGQELVSLAGFGPLRK